LKMFLPLPSCHQDWVKAKTVLVSPSELQIIRLNMLIPTSPRVDGILIRTQVFAARQ
jgi:hypothetical protein